MPRKASGNFDQSKYQNEWAKQNMLRVSAGYKADFVLEFKDACKKLGLSQSEVFRRAMQETIDESKKAG